MHFNKASSEITKRHLKKLGMRFVNHEWIMAKELAVGNLEQMDEETKAEVQQELAHQWSRLSLS